MMQYAAFVLAIFGLMAYLEQSSLKKRIADLERQLTEIEGTSYHEDRGALLTAAKSYIGRSVRLELKEDYEDVDVIMYGNSNKGSNTILDADDTWILVRVDGPKGSREKLLRMEGLQRISVLEK